MRRAARGFLASASVTGLLALTGAASAGPSTLQQTNPVLWVTIGLSLAGAAITYAVLAYALWKFRDPHTRGRRYG